MKVLITPRSFGKNNPDLFYRLERAGLALIRNDTGAILSADQMKELLAPCEGVIVGVDPLDANVLASAPKLRAISKYGVGLDNIDLKLCEERGIKVSRTVGANSEAVADYAFGLMIAVARRIAYIDRRCREKDWKKITTIDVYGKTLGIIGLGAIGKRVALRAKGFAMRVFAHDPLWDADFAASRDIVRASVDDICRDADFISLHCNLTPETAGLINKERIASMKKNAVLINTARGALIDEDALLSALKTESIYGAGVDVFDKEPPDNPEWYKLDNVIMGSHCSSSTKGATEMMGAMAVNNLLRDLGLPL